MSGSAANLESYHRHSRYVTNGEQAECHGAVAAMLKGCPRLRQLATPIPITSARYWGEGRVGEIFGKRAQTTHPLSFVWRGERSSQCEAMGIVEALRAVL